jgi:hypothetical protein
MIEEGGGSVNGGVMAVRIAPTPVLFASTIPGAEG